MHFDGKPFIVAGYFPGAEKDQHVNRMFNQHDRGSGYLFSSYHLGEWMDRVRHAVREEIAALDGNRLLNTSPTDLATYLMDKYSREVPKLRRDAWVAESMDVKLDLNAALNTGVYGGGHRSSIPAQQFKIEVPIEGDSDLLFAMPSVGNMSPPKALVEDHSLFLIFNVLHDAPETQVKSEADQKLNEIEGWLSTIARDLEGFPASIRYIADSAIKARRERLLLVESRAASLGIPLKTRPDAPKTYVAPEVRQKIIPVLPPASSAPYVCEPVLADEQYEYIIGALQGMTLVMERNPSAFKTMGEEDLRQQFLVPLNLQFEGGATAETFNFGGKTDILIRIKDKNIFIAECKFWKGPKGYRETIDQLLGYKSWRDTKTAILIFNRDTAMSKVLEAVAVETVAHPNFKRKTEWKTETGARYVFHHTGDPNQEFVLTVLVFDVPGRAEAKP